MTASQSGGMRIEKPSLRGQCGPLFLQVFSTIKGKTKAKPFQALLLRGYTIAIIMAMHKASICSTVRGPGPAPSAPKWLKSNVHVKS